MIPWAGLWRVTLIIAIEMERLAVGSAHPWLGSWTRHVKKRGWVATCFHFYLSPLLGCRCNASNCFMFLLPCFPAMMNCTWNCESQWTFLPYVALVRVFYPSNRKRKKILVHISSQHPTATCLGHLPETLLIHPWLNLGLEEQRVKEPSTLTVNQSRIPFF